MRGFATGVGCKADIGAAPLTQLSFLFALAAEQGFIGLAAYVACWVFLFPVMLIICTVIGFFLMWASREE